jgi:activator of 2-hydroxyglutaryl-CoA dehydratase/predicted nucleotide-binding protein (sugar kinase/HSP70/actin superfamily)
VKGTLDPAKGTRRAVGIDLGSTTVKAVVVQASLDAWGEGEILVVDKRAMGHDKDPRKAVASLLHGIDLDRIHAIAATGRLSRVLRANQVPAKAALRQGVRFVHPELDGVTVLSIGAHGFCVLELGAGGEDWFQQNSRCSQGTGNFLSQLVQRFGLDVDEAAELCEDEPDPAPLSGRCPVILKTDMTHLANKGESKSRILAGLYDAVCENVVTLLRPRIAPPDVVLVGGVARSARVRRKIASWLAERGMHLVQPKPGDAYLEAIGAALCAIDSSTGDAIAPRLLGRHGIDDLLVSSIGTALERVPSLRGSLSSVHRLTREPAIPSSQPRDVLLGLDIGSTGSKVVAIDAETGQPAWESYLNTEGAPVHAAQRLVRRWTERGSGDKIVAFGVTGSGREVVGSLLRTCYGKDRVFVMNEIAAHARGAAELDPAVDTIFEIGGQDAKYIRLEGGRVVDAAMNEACSAGTGSFIAEQGAKFDGIAADPVSLAKLALEADSGISLGQHCSVFMAEVIDEAIAQGVEQNAIILGLYDSVIQNYLNRVKGARSVGQRIFCQGMPFSSDALASAVARQTGRDVVVPPNPGTIGAHGIALLLKDELAGARHPAADPHVFLASAVSAKETIVCRSTKGCGGSGNHCRIDRLTTLVGGTKQRFLWGGNCSLYDRGMGRKKLPDLAPDPFREREALVVRITADTDDVARPVVAIADEFAGKSIAPLLIVFLQKLGFECRVLRGATASTLRKGIEGARIPFCAPVQLLHGAAFELAESGAEYLLLPMIKDLPRQKAEEHGQLCPMVLGAPDLVTGVLGKGGPRVLRPVIEFGKEGYRGGPFTQSMRAWADELAVPERFDAALSAAIDVQIAFEKECVEIGRRALDFCSHEGVVPVAVLGRPYTIYSDVLNSNVPSILRSLGAMPIPVDCIPVPDDTPVYDQQYWAHTQRNLRVAEYVRRTPGLYSVFCSNYACGPDSFTLHFYSYTMRGKPFAVVETDGHSGDAGTKTRMEAFLFCVDTDQKTGASTRNPRTDFAQLEGSGVGMQACRDAKLTMLVPNMGPAADVAVATLRGDGYVAETLPFSTRDDVRRGRQFTSGKECLPMILTIGTALGRLESEPDPKRRFAVFMPTAKGPCRFGVYHSLYRIILEQAGWADRAKVVSPDDSNYYSEMSVEFTAKMWVGFCAQDLLEMMLRDVRPIETERGGANAIYDRYRRELLETLERPSKGTLASTIGGLFGGLWGTKNILGRAAAEFAAIKSPTRQTPTVAVVGEIYARLDPFANDFVVDKLEERGIRARLAPFFEWLEYTMFQAEERVRTRRLDPGDRPISIGLQGLVQRATLAALYGICQRALGWGPRLRIEDTIEAAREYVHPDLRGEAALTVGGPVHEFRNGEIDGVVIVGPHECMPCKIAEAQHGLAAETLKQPYVSIALNGDPMDTEVLDRFAFDIHQRFRAARVEDETARHTGVGRPSGWRLRKGGVDQPAKRTASGMGA